MEMNLKFNLPEERDEAKLAFKANSLWSVLWDFDQYLRSIIKYEDEYHNIETVVGLRQMLHEYMETYDLSFDMVS